MNTRELTKTVLTLPWALSMFGIQQAATLVSSSGTKRLSDAGKALDAVTAAATREFDGWAKQTYQFGDTVQRTLVDLAMMRTPEIDSSALMRMAAEMQSSPVFQAVLKYGMPPVGWVGSLMVSRRDRTAVGQEFTNKITVITLVTQVHDQLGLHEGNEESLSALVAKAAELETFPRLWAVEGIGNYIGDRAVAQAGARATGLLSGPDAEGLPVWSLTMLHAGIGMSFAKHVLKPLEPTTAPAAVRAAIAEFVALCRASSWPGYAGAALESLGLATRTLYPSLVRIVDAQIPAVEPDLLGYFWHGVGRAMYFEPANMLPSVNAPWRAIRRLDEEAPHDTARRNILSGLSWAITVVNMRHPVVMEALLRHHGVMAAEDDAFSNGVTSALLMRYDTTRDDARIAPFVHNEPVGDDDLAALWRTLITGPCEDGLQRTYPRLRETRSLEALFRYHAAD